MPVDDSEHIRLLELKIKTFQDNLEEVFLYEQITVRMLS